VVLRKNSGEDIKGGGWRNLSERGRKVWAGVQKKKVTPFSKKEGGWRMMGKDTGEPQREKKESKKDLSLSTSLECNFGRRL